MCVWITNNANVKLKSRQNLSAVFDFCSLKKYSHVCQKLTDNRLQYISVYFLGFFVKKIMLKNFKMPMQGYPARQHERWWCCVFVTFVDEFITISCMEFIISIVFSNFYLICEWQPHVCLCWILKVHMVRPKPSHGVYKKKKYDKFIQWETIDIAKQMLQFYILVKYHQTTTCKHP